VPRIDDWIAALETRHRGNLTTSEFAKAVRALSARYVERRAALADRSVGDSAGKRAAFADYYAPLHFFTVREIVRALGAATLPLDRIIDFGCGTGAASAAWALECQPSPSIDGIDAAGWALIEASWTWRTLDLRGRGRRGDLVADVERMTRSAVRDRHGLLFAWSLNELDDGARAKVAAALSSRHARSAALLVIEPLARGAAPWWDEWARTLSSPNLRQDEWHFDVALPVSLAAIDEAAGFRRDELGARSLWRPPLPSQ
jgi:hypothetical protein